MLYLCYLCRFKPLRDHLRGFLIAAWAGDKIAEFSFPEISFHFPLRPWFFFVSPAYAGKRESGRNAVRYSWDHPRMCGEKQESGGSSGTGSGSPPRMRGKSAHVPAAFRRSRDHPRVCGEKQTVSTTSPAALGSPPHVRGKVVISRYLRLLSRITPACAGKRGTRRQSVQGAKDHPRMCGEKKLTFDAGQLIPGSPPHVRGKVCLVLAQSFELGITPACAGKRQPDRRRPRVHQDHPRMCGEKAAELIAAAPSKGSPPHVRGKD